MLNENLHSCKLRKSRKSHATRLKSMNTYVVSSIKGLQSDQSTATI